MGTIGKDVRMNVRFTGVIIHVVHVIVVHPGITIAANGAAQSFNLFYGSKLREVNSSRS